MQTKRREIEITGCVLGGVNAYVYKGLAVHKYPTEYLKDKQLFWRVTHIESGLFIQPQFKTKKEAMIYMKKLLELGDWTLSEEAMRGYDSSFLKAFRALRKEMGWDLDEE